MAVEARYDIVLAGHHPQVRPEMVVLDGLAERRPGREDRAPEWRSRVPVLDANYQRSLEGAQRAAKTKAGASGSVAPRKVPGLPDGDQPVAYAARLEFGDADRPAEPSARPAFDTARDRAVHAADDVLAKAAAGVAR